MSGTRDIGNRVGGGRKNYEARHFPFLPPLTPPAPAPPRGSLTIRRPSAAGDHHPALSVQGTHEENGKPDNRSPPFRVLKGWPQSGRVSSSFVQGTNEAKSQNALGINEESTKRVALPREHREAVRGQNRFEESIISIFPIKVPGCHFPSGAPIEAPGSGFPFRGSRKACTFLSGPPMTFYFPSIRMSSSWNSYQSSSFFHL